MHFITPYILTYLQFFSYTYLVGTYAFIHKDLCQLFQISKTTLGFCNGLVALASLVGVIIFLINSVRIKARIITYFTWGSIGVMFPYAFIVLASLLYDVAPKFIFYVSVALFGLFRSIFFQSLLIIIKMHKEIYDRTNKINEHNYKLLTNLWSPSFGMAAGFFMCNWLEYSMGIRWQILLLTAVLMKLVTTTMLFFGLRTYLEDDEHDELTEDHITKHKGSTATVSTFFSLVNDHLPSKFFLINATVCESLHIQFSYVLPVFFYDSGYKGNEGYLTAFYTISIVIGAYVIAISDYLLHVTAENKQSQAKEGEVKDESKKDRAIFLFVFSVSLFFFLATFLVFTVLSFGAEKHEINVNEGDTSVNLLIMLMCAIGFFLGGPLRSYYSYKAIKAMGSLEKEFKKKIEKDVSFRERQEKSQQLAVLSNASFCDKIHGHKLEVGSSLVTTNRILTYFSTFVLFILSFYLIDKYLSYTMVLFSILGVVALVFDIIQNWIAIQEEKKEEMQKVQEMALEKNLLKLS